MPIVSRGTSVLQIGGDGCAYLGRQRQELFTASLTPHTEMASTPVEIPEFQPDDLVSANAQTCQK
jgi:hypothetical protein